MEEVIETLKRESMVVGIAEGKLLALFMTK